MQGFVAKSSWQKQDGSKVHFLVDGFMESPRIGLTRTMHACKIRGMCWHTALSKEIMS
jgi:hypothetical protein